MSPYSTVQYLPPACVEADPDRPARSYPPSLIKRLAAQIKAKGLRPIRVREVGGRWFVISVADESRRQACIAAGLEAIPCWIIQSKQ